MLRESKDLVEVIIEAIGDKKGYDIKVMNVMAATTLTDYFLFCTSDSDVQSRAIASNINEKLETILERRMPQPEGYANGEWLVIDAKRVIVHVFLPELREKFNLEEFWAKQLEKAERIKEENGENPKAVKEAGKTSKVAAKKGSKASEGKKGAAAGKGKKAAKPLSAKEAVESKLKKSVPKKKSAAAVLDKVAKKAKSAKEAIEEEILKSKAKKEAQRETAVKKAAKAKKAAPAGAKAVKKTAVKTLVSKKKTAKK